MEITSTTNVTKGFLTENHFLESDTGKYFLKKYRFNNKRKIEEIHEVKKYFSDGGIPVILPIKTIGGNTFFEFQSGFYAIFPFISGRELGREELTETAIRSLGEMLGHIHLLGKKALIQIEDKPYARNQVKSLDRNLLIINNIKSQETLSELDRIALADLELKTHLLETSPVVEMDQKLPHDHLIHGDYLISNVFFSSSDTVSSVFDFEKTIYASRLFELFRSMMLGFYDNTDKLRMYLDSYSIIYPVSKEEVWSGLINYFRNNIHGAWPASEYYLHNNIRVAQLIIEDAKRTKYISDNFHRIEEKLLN